MSVYTLTESFESCGCFDLYLKILEYVSPKKVLSVSPQCHYQQVRKKKSNLLITFSIQTTFKSSQFFKLEFGQDFCIASDLSF